jgi:ubiquinone biosynthesis protein
VNWDFLLNEAAVAAVLPGDYARWQQPIRGALVYFLAGLPPERQAAILAAQATLPASATLAERLALLARNCPTLHKLGQILARDRHLAAELRHRLRDLESLPSSIPFETLHEVLTQELGPLERLGARLVPPALAEASVAVVIPFRADLGPRG